MPLPIAAEPAQPPTTPAPPAATASPATPSGAPVGRLDSARLDLGSIEASIGTSEEQRRTIEGEIEQIRTDRVRLAAELIETTERVRDTEARVAEVEHRLETLTGSETAIRSSLAGRRRQIAAVLGALERIGRRPVPAILARPEDMLVAVRTSMLLGAIVPELRAETEQLASDLEELSRLRGAIALDRDKLTHELTDLSAERTRLAALIEARQAAQAAAESALAAEQQRAADLARQATSLKDLIARLQAEAGPAKRAADAAEAAARQTSAAEDEIKARLAAGPFKDPARLAPAVAFAEVKGLLSLPVSGTIVRQFGADDGFGSPEHGISIATRPKAVVSMPCDGWVAFSGPYRSYGQLLIINTGSGYHIVLAGLERTNVTPGQFILAGEPIGTMGDGSVKTAAAVALGAAQPILYVEFRKDGAAIDPSPWWAKPDLEKVRG